MAPEKTDRSIASILDKSNKNTSNSLKALDSVYSGFIMSAWQVRLSRAHIDSSKNLLSYLTAETDGDVHRVDTLL